MESLSKKLHQIQTKTAPVKVMILGLGSVGNYFLDYLCNLSEPNIEIIVVGRNRDKMEKDVNIIKVASNIRGQLRSNIFIESGCDFNYIDNLKHVMEKHHPDFIVNTSRAFSGLKYGSLSWKNLRAYGIWSPLAVKYLKNIMKAAETAAPEAIVINTSYSDVTIPWLKSAGWAYPDFGSGNLNHLIPRIRFAAAELKGISDFWNIDVTVATGHFHDVVISKEGQNEGISQLINLSYQGKSLTFEESALLEKCKIPMPTDAKRNMMNASSNLEIIQGVLEAIREKEIRKLHIPGAAGKIGGYPVIIDCKGTNVRAYIDESIFSMKDMELKNKLSIQKDGIEKIENGKIFYTDDLLERVKDVFHTKLPKAVALEDSDEVAELIIEEIIKKNI